MERLGYALMRVLRIVLMALVAAGACGGAVAQVPDKLNYQGRLTDPGGAPVNTSVPMVFKLYNVASGGAALYAETQTVNVANGIFNVAIGSVTPLNLPFDVPYYLGVSVGADAEMTPRQQVLASAYAQRADTANALASTATVGGAQITGSISVATVPAVQLTGTIGTAQIASNAVTQAKLSPVSGAAAGKVLGTDGSNLQWQSAGGAGTVTSVATGAGLQGGPITASGTVDLRLNATGGLTKALGAGSNELGIAGGAVDVAKLDTASTDARYFKQGGNAFGATAVLGTTDNQALEINVNGTRVMRYEAGISGSPNIIGGSSNNSVNFLLYGQTIGGGGGPGNTCYDPPTDTFTRSCGNQASLFATVGGGYSNAAGGSNSTVGGGNSNSAYNFFATVGGGANNTASGEQSTIAGGGGNTASGQSSTIAGGASNTASGLSSTIAGGAINIASGSYSFAGGYRAKTQTAGGTPTIHDGAFVWADSNYFDFNTGAANEFAARATGGVRFVTAIDSSGNPARTMRINPNAEVEFGNQTRQMLNLWGPAQYGIGVQTATLYFRSPGGYSWHQHGAHSNAPNDPGGGTELMRLEQDGTLYVTNGTVGTLSDRAAKRDFAPVDAANVLDKVARMPISSWVYKANPGVRHMGPTAQDFRAAFGLGDDNERSIATVDADGVALAAIQGLYAELRDRDGTIAGLQREITLLKQDRQVQLVRLDALEKQADEMTALKAQVSELAQLQQLIAPVIALGSSRGAK